jgi:RNA polymerase sigma factor (sigma-70 family)
VEVGAGFDIANEGPKVDYVRAPALEMGEELLFRPALQAFVRRQISDRHDSEDVVQETYVRLYSYSSRSSVDDVKAFCFAVARNLISDRFRAGARLAAEPIPTDFACPEPRADEVVAYRRAMDLLVTCVSAMPPLRREIFLRKRLDGDSTAAIASDLEMSLAAVEKHVVRALRDLRSVLHRHGFSLQDGA